MDNRQNSFSIPDINKMEPDHGVIIDKVGILNLKHPVKTIFNNSPTTIPAEFNIWIELPKRYRAAHMSRNLESLQKVLFSNIENEFNQLDINQVCLLIAEHLILNHDYSNKVFVEILFDYFTNRFTPGKKYRNLEFYKVKLSTLLVKKSHRTKINHSIEVTVEGTTTCPCAQNQSKYLSIKKMAEAKIHIDRSIIENFLYHTHMQRALVNLRLEGMSTNEVSIDDLITIAESSMSNGTQGLLKRADEEILIREAFLHPKFVEDVIRTVAYKLAVYPHEFGKGTKVHISVETQESIHKHNAFAEISTTVQNLKRVLG